MARDLDDLPAGRRHGPAPAGTQRRPSRLWLASCFILFWLAACAPAIFDVRPNQVPADGGIQVVITGENLSGAELTVGGTPVPIDSTDERTIAFSSPPHQPGKAPIRVTTKGGSATHEDFSFVAEPQMKYIIEFAAPQGIDAARADPSLAERRVARLTRRHGISANAVVGVSPLPYVIARDLSQEEIERLRNDPEIKAVHRNAYREIQVAESLAVIEQPQAYAWGATGEGFAIAVLDTGANYRHADLGACESAGPDCRVKVSLDMTPVDDGELDADPDKHGTNVAAIAALTAPKAGIIALDVFDASGLAADSDIIQALNWVIANRAAHDIVAVNMSLGSKEGHQPACSETVYDSAFEWLLRDGIQVVAAAGNEAKKDRLAIPACHPLAISVGATTDALRPAHSSSACSDPALPVDSVPCFSNSAATLDILAPGTNIQAGGVAMSGTSQAAPHVSGALAALKSKFPTRTSAQLLLRLQQTGKAITDANGVLARRINLAAAMNDHPKANPDSATSLEGGGVIIDVLANDVDEHLSMARVDGIAIDDEVGAHAAVFNNRIYFHSEPNVTGIVRFRYSMADEYGALSTAEVTVDIQPVQNPVASPVAGEPAFVSKAGLHRDNPFIVYEAGLTQGHRIWLQWMDAHGKPNGPRVSISGNNADVVPGHLDLQADADGYTVSWITQRSLDGRMLVMAANGDLVQIPGPYHPGFSYNQDGRHPWVVLFDGVAVVGWEHAWNPSRRYAQAMSRSVSHPAPHGSLQEFPGYPPPVDAQEAVRVSASEYLHLSTSTSKKYISAMRIHREGQYMWDAFRTLPDWNGLPPAAHEQIADFDAVQDGDGLAIAWTHAQYSGRYGVSFQRIDGEAHARSAPVSVLAELNAMGDMAMIRLADGSHRIVWTEVQGDFAAIVSAAVSPAGAIGERRIDYWTRNSNEWAPQQVEALVLSDTSYLLSWSNPKRQLMSLVRPGTDG